MPDVKSLAALSLAVVTALILSAFYQESRSAQARAGECSQSCMLVEAEMVVANRYGCFCRDGELDEVFMLSPEVDAE